MDFGSISGRSTKSSMKKKSLLSAFRKSSQPPPTSYHPPPSSTSTHFPEPDSPYAESISSSHHASSSTYHGGSSDFNPMPSSATTSRYADSIASTSMSARTAIASVSGTGTSEGFLPQYGRGGAARKRTTSGTVSVTTTGSDGKGGSGKRDQEYKDKERDREREKSGGAAVRRPEDLVKVVRDRLFSWSYMMQWYQGDTHWFNTVKIPRTATETYLGPKHLESRARNYFILGISLGLLFDIANAGDYLRAVNKVLEEWDAMVEGGSKVRGLFKGQKGNRKSGGASGEYSYMGMQDGDSSLLQVNLPFTLDFFQIHSTTCSLIRDIYKKTLRLFLPARPPTSAWTPPAPDPTALLHPSTIIHSAPLDAPFPSRTNSSDQPFSQQGSGPASASASAHAMRSPSTRSTSSNSHSHSNGHGYSQTPILSPRSALGEMEEHLTAGMGVEQALLGKSASASGQSHSGPGGVTMGETEHDAFQAYILGELGTDRTLVGEGQAVTKETVELFTKVDARLRKHLSTLLRETDLLARRVLDEELNMLMASLDPSAKPLAFDYTAALSQTGNGFVVGGGSVAPIRTHSNTSTNANQAPSVSRARYGPLSPMEHMSRGPSSSGHSIQVQRDPSINTGERETEVMRSPVVPTKRDEYDNDYEYRGHGGGDGGDGRVDQQPPRGVPMGLPEGFNDEPINGIVPRSGSRSLRGAGVPEDVSDETHEMSR